MRKMRLFMMVVGITLSSIATAQKNATFQQYIDQYKEAAIDQMRRYRIPASITLAQALLESGAGSSYLARTANNHFGIKVSGGWTGPYVTRDDDDKDERFRKYSHVSESYEDHSKFLLKDRYKSLFDLNPQDYKGWARGLKACGYATSPTYANRLITIIETYELFDLDEDRLGFRRYKRPEPPVYVAPTRHSVRMVNGVQCVTAREGDTWEGLAKELKISKKKLLKFNEISEDYQPAPGMNIFLDKKAKKAEAQYKDTWHKVQSGESMYAIAQYYGIRLESLYKMNFKDDSYVPATGDLLKVR
ncbi:MAG: LysM peptidoglycan-binding domain-containing protein [Bacteroidales bacterium]|nr:LysM peptidoglycan-binding domain-containing protein [Bacteroidales bacterium]